MNCAVYLKNKICSLNLIIRKFLNDPFQTGETENVCAGKEFRLPVYSTSRTVTFTPDSGEPRRVLLENTFVSVVLLMIVFIYS